MKIIVLNMNHIGDVLFTTPALAALQKGHPDAAITVVAGGQAVPVLAENPAVARLLELPRKPAERWRMVRALRRERFELSVCFSSSNVELGAWGWLLGCRSRWGFDRPETRWFLTGRLPHRPVRHWMEDYLDIGCAAGGKENGRALRAYVTPDEERWADAYCAEAGIDPQRFVVGVHMGASFLQKCWRPERYAELACLAASERSAQTVVFGGEAEAGVGAALARGAPDVVNLAGRLPLRQFMALVRRCSLFVGVDTGPTHLAAALGVPTIALYGFTNPARMGTLGERVAILEKGGNWNGAVMREGETPYVWLDPITAQEVWETACRLTAS